jgi:nudix-type nucleoside diphosphatase (YffH/AdpP family)
MGDVATAAAFDVMGLMGLSVPHTIARRRSQMLIRAASRLRAAAPAPAKLRRGAVPDDVAVERWREPYAHFFSVEETDLRFRRFDGAMSAPVNRAVFISGDAVTVLPYDPALDRVLLIEQFRAGPFARGDANPWSLEVIAGRIDAGETPEEAGRREAVEEAGLALAELIPVSRYYPSPGAKSEYIYSYLAIVDLPDALSGTIGGVAEEAEDIRTHLVSFDQLMDLVATGEIENAPVVISALSLARLRPGLRGAA